MGREEQARAFFLRELRRCPSLRLQDLCKGLYQGVMGCEHLLSSGPEALALAEESIRQEAAALGAAPAGPAVELLPGPYGRASLHLTRAGLSPRTLAAAFLASSRRPRGTAEALEALTQTLLELVRAGALACPAEEAEAALAAWKAAGFPPCRHSEAYRQACRPAYRVLHGCCLRLLPLLTEIDRLLERRERVLLAVEGPCGSGKTTLGQLLEELYDAAVFHGDDFFLRPGQRTEERLAQPGGNLDRERLEEEVLAPLRRGEAAVFRRYDCQKDALSPPVTVSPRRLNVVEGVYSFHPDLAGYYDLSVFLELTPRTQRRRIRQRCGTKEAAAVFFRRWIPLENAYFEAAGTRARCKLRLEEEREGERDE